MAISDLHLDKWAAVSPGVIVHCMGQGLEFFAEKNFQQFYSGK